MKIRIFSIITLTVFLSGCGSCLDPFSHLSDCPSVTPGGWVK